MRLWEHSSNLDWLVTILGVGRAESDPNVLQEKCSWFCNRYLWGFGVLLLARGARASKTGLRAATEIFYGWYQGALQDSEMNQTFLPIARIAKGIIWYSKKWKKKKNKKKEKKQHYEQAAYSLHASGHKVPVYNRPGSSSKKRFSNQGVPVSNAPS